MLSHNHLPHTRTPTTFPSRIPHPLLALPAFPGGRPGERGGRGRDGKGAVHPGAVRSSDPRPRPLRGQEHRQPPKLRQGQNHPGQLRPPRHHAQSGSLRVPVNPNNSALASDPPRAVPQNSHLSYPKKDRSSILGYTYIYIGSPGQWSGGFFYESSRQSHCAGDFQPLGTLASCRGACSPKLATTSDSKH